MSEESRLERAIQGGAELLSKTVGASVGLLGPEVALAAPTVETLASHALRRIGETVVNMVGRGAAERAGAAIVVIEADRLARDRNGEAPRSDDAFNEERDGLRPDSDELLEGVLMYAAASYEQRKVVLLAHLYDGIAFDASVTPQQGHFMLKLADQLTYRQLVALVVLQDEKSATELQTASFRRDQGEVAPSDAVALELDDLTNKGPLGLRVEGTDDIARPGELIESAGPASRRPFQDLKLTPIGLTMHRLMRLETIPADDRVRLLEELTIPVHPI